MFTQRTLLIRHNTLIVLPWIEVSSTSQVPLRQIKGASPFQRWRDEVSKLGISLGRDQRTVAEHSTQQIRSGGLCEFFPWLVVDEKEEEFGLDTVKKEWLLKKKRKSQDTYCVWDIRTKGSQVSIYRNFTVEQRNSHARPIQQSL